jgi:predicted rRNA methylase YqxC with S4 and FtsJ domains
MDKEIEEKIELAIANIEISEKVLSNISQNPLENLERICPGISKIKPNWQLIRQNIKTKDTENIKTEEDIHKLMEKINETITVDNI